MKEIWKECCEHYGTTCQVVKSEQLVAISKGVLEGTVPVEGVRYPSPDHMSGWWLTTDEYNGNIDSLKTVHFEHIIECRPDLAMYMALPFGYRFDLGGESEHVWFDEDVLEESN